MNSGLLNFKITYFVIPAKERTTKGRRQKSTRQKRANKRSPTYERRHKSADTGAQLNYGTNLVESSLAEIMPLSDFWEDTKKERLRRNRTGHFPDILFPLFSYATCAVPSQ